MIGRHDCTSSVSYREDEFLDKHAVNETFRSICRKLDVVDYRKKMGDLVIYEMIDGMRTSTNLSGIKAYLEGGMFAARVVYFLKALGAKSCYINVTEEKHVLRENYLHILRALKQLYVFYEEFAGIHAISYRFLGNPIAQSRDTRIFMKELMLLEEKTSGNTEFLASFLINYSLAWAMQNTEAFNDLPEANVIVRHTKLQAPTGMLLPPSKSDNTSLVFVQQGAPSRTWSDYQILCLIGTALRSKVMNYGTQYTKAYDTGENERIRRSREIEAQLVYKQLAQEEQELLAQGGDTHFTKRVVLGTPLAFEIYEF